jgi:hypothetical protein
MEALKEELRNCKNKGDTLLLKKLINEKTTELNILIEHYSHRKEI